ncbi:hypothetical protein AKG95_04990 [Janthinobacterium lividum]|uniref:Uncharacterized protein n=1 Tax=Janthinobacterium lividum TaxID=29581 RepID=A0A1S1UDU4_9BURK|nr:hypothetical protein AKG95_04990 [Janthinobacterium lividum]
MAALRLLALDIFQARLARYACADDWGVNAFCWCAGGLGSARACGFFGAVFGTLITLISGQNLRQCSINFIGQFHNMKCYIVI